MFTFRVFFLLFSFFCFCKRGEFLRIWNDNQVLFIFNLKEPDLNSGTPKLPPEEKEETYVLTSQKLAQVSRVFVIWW